MQLRPTIISCKDVKGGPMNNTNSNTSTPRRPDCVTKVHMGGTVLVVSGYFKQDATATAADKMIRVLKAEIADTSRKL